VNISSNGGVNGAPFLASYTASKFAVRGLTHVAAQELGPEVRVNTLVPGGIRTPLSHSDEFGAGEGVDDAVASVTPLRRIGLPEEVAQAALFLASDASSYCTGMELVVDGGLLAGGGTAAMSRSVLGVGHLATR
jgi:3alpha(or 20beta)-hydroxysteroid dehydrogenase